MSIPSSSIRFPDPSAARRRGSAATAGTAALRGLVLALVAGAGRLCAQSDALNLWNDPAFQKQFVAGYGVNAEIEPRVTPQEVKLLEKLRPLMSEDLPAAEALLREELNADASAILDFTLGSLQYQQGNMEDALVNFREAVRKFPSFRRAWRNIGFITVENGSHDDAIAAFVKMLELGGGDAYSYGLLGLAYRSKQDYQAAEAAYRNALLLQPDNLQWRFGLTTCAFKQEKFEDCAALLDVLIARYPENADFWLLQAQAFLGLKQPLRAAENFEAVDRLGKGTAESLHTLGDIYVTENLMDLAVNAYLRSIDADLNQPFARPLQSAEVLAARNAIPQARLVVGRLREAWGTRMAEEDRRKLLKIDARLSMAEGAGSDETAAVLEELVKVDPLDGEALLLLGQHYARENQPDRAIFYYERAESIEAFAVRAMTGHAQVLVSMARYADAVPLLRSAQEARPREDIARYLEQVERLARTR